MHPTEVCRRAPPDIGHGRRILTIPCGESPWSAAGCTIYDRRRADNDRIRVDRAKPDARPVGKDPGPTTELVVGADPRRPLKNQVSGPLAEETLRIDKRRSARVQGRCPARFAGVRLPGSRCDGAPAGRGF